MMMNRMVGREVGCERRNFAVRRQTVAFDYDKRVLVVPCEANCYKFCPYSVKEAYDEALRERERQINLGYHFE